MYSPLSIPPPGTPPGQKFFFIKYQYDGIFMIFKIDLTSIDVPGSKLFGHNHLMSIGIPMTLLLSAAEIKSRFPHVFFRDSKLFLNDFVSDKLEHYTTNTLSEM